MNFENNEETIGLGDSERCIEIPWALSKYSNEQTVLDIGSANAEERYIKSLLSLKIPNLHGLDISDKKIEGIISHIGDIRNTNFDDNFFDLVFCISTIEHIGRDNSVYTVNFNENLDNGDFDAMKEMYRVTKNNGKIVITIPFGKLFDYGWFIHYDENRLNKLLNSSPVGILKKEFFKYENGWHKCDKNDLKDILYKDNNAIAAAGLVCLFLEKKDKNPVSIQKGTAYYLERIMNDNTIEIRDDEINVEEIMTKIRENIQRRQAAGEIPSDPDSVIASTSKNCYSGESDDAIQRDLSYLNSNWDIHNNSYFISSHHPYIGKFLVSGRRMIHGEVRRYVDPIIFHQTEFNASTVRIITQTSQQCIEQAQRQQELVSAFSSFKQESDRRILDCINTTKSELDSITELTTKELTTAKNELDSITELTTKELTTAKNELDLKIELIAKELTIVKSELDSKIELTTKELTTVKSELDTTIELTTKELTTVKSELDTTIELTINELFSQMDDDINATARLVHMLEDRVQKGLLQKRISPASNLQENTNYYLFEERFRGSRKDIKQRQLAFLPYFEKCSRVLDIGCGRGEFLEILKDHAIGCIGVDSDPDMVAYCHSRQLEVEQSDAITYLETLDDKSLDGVFIDQVVEHLEPEYLVRLLALCHQKMKFGYYIIIETVNPLSFVSFVNFYIDMTHKKPVHPETLQYLFSALGFRECEKKFFSPVSDEGRLKKIENKYSLDEAVQKIIEAYNYNTELLNTVLFGAQDYAVIGKK
jgi:SAM-dependent methyltransferase